MSKNIKSLMIALAFCVSLSGCNTNSASSDVEVITTSQVANALTEVEITTEDEPILTETTTVGEVVDEVESSNETSEISEEVAEERINYDLATEFLDALKNGYGNEVLGGDYDFLNTLKMNSYDCEFLGTNSYQSQGYYKVVLDVESCDEYIPAGESEWFLSVGSDAMGYVESFIPMDVHDKTVNFDSYDPEDLTQIAVGYATNFSCATKLYSATNKELDGYDLPNDQIHMLYHALPLEYDNGVTVEEFIATMKSTFSLNVTAEQVQETGFIADDGMLKRGCAHGGAWLYYDVMSIDWLGDNGLMINIVYYGDYGKFYPVKECNYYFNYEEDKSLFLQSIESVMDKGIEVARGSI